MIKKVSSRQSRVLERYQSFIKKNGHSPTYAEAARGLGLTTGAVFFHIKNLAKMGYLHVGELTKKIEGRSDLYKIPILGSIACGEPIEVNEEIEDYIDIGKSLLPKSGEYYCLIAKGDSMKNANIADGDYLIIKKQDDIDANGDIAVVIDKSDNDEKATLKRVYKTPTHLILEPENEEFPTTFKTQCGIRGKLVKVIKNY